jgi:hypothetical protein
VLKLLDCVDVPAGNGFKIFYRERVYKNDSLPGTAYRERVGQKVNYLHLLKKAPGTQTGNQNCNLANLLGFSFPVPFPVTRRSRSSSLQVSEIITFSRSRFPVFSVPVPGKISNKTNRLPFPVFCSYYVRECMCLLTTYPLTVLDEENN